MRIPISFDCLLHEGAYDFQIDRAGILIRVPRDVAEITGEHEMMVEDWFAEREGLSDRQT